MNINSRISYTAVREDKTVGRDRPFDLEVGDIVKLNRMADLDRKHYTVTGIYDRLFTVVDKLGIPSSFTKLEYMIGEVVLVQKAWKEHSWGELAEGGK